MGGWFNPCQHNLNQKYWQRKTTRILVLLATRDNWQKKTYRLPYFWRNFHFQGEIINLGVEWSLLVIKYPMYYPTHLPIPLLAPRCNIHPKMVYFNLSLKGDLKTSRRRAKEDNQAWADEHFNRSVQQITFSWAGGRLVIAPWEASSLSLTSSSSSSTRLPSVLSIKVIHHHSKIRTV